VDLWLERLKCKEEHFGTDSVETTKTRNDMKTLFNSSVRVWRLFISMLQNDRSVFSMTKTLSLMDEAMKNMCAYVRGEKRSHLVDEGSEDFLVELIVQRCKLLIESGHTHRAVAAMQGMGWRRCCYGNY
jgi:NRDE-2, necessary for RNA interference